jgi:hypothetical protein
MTELGAQKKIIGQETDTRVKKLQSQVDSMKEQLGLFKITILICAEMATELLRRIREERDYDIGQKDLCILEQQVKIESLSREFGEILKNTLDKVGKKVETISSLASPSSSISFTN